MFRTLIKKLITLFRRDPAVESRVSQTISNSEAVSTSNDDWIKEKNQMPEYKGDGKECPFCKSTNVRSFMYGLIRFSSDEDKKETLKTHVLGGCSIDSWSPKYICNACDKRFGLY